MPDRRCVHGRTGDDRVYRGSVQGHTCDVQGMTVKTQGMTGEDRGFSFRQGFLEPVVIISLLIMCVFGFPITTKEHTVGVTVSRGSSRLHGSRSFL